MGLVSIGHSKSNTRNNERVSACGRNKSFILPRLSILRGKVFKPTASRIWTMLQNQESIVSEYLNPDKSELAFKQIHQAAISVSNGLIDEYRSSQEILINREKTRLAQYDIYQQDTIDKAGLENVRRFRQQKLGLFNDQIEKEINAFKTIYPELECLIVISLGGTNG